MVLVFVSSIVCFASGEQPSGNDYYSIYSPRSYSTTWERKNFWTAQNNLFQRLLFLLDGNGSSDTVSIRQRLLNLDNSTSDLPDLIDTLTDVTVGNHLGYYFKNTSDKLTAINTSTSSLSSSVSSVSDSFSTLLSYFGDPSDSEYGFHTLFGMVNNISDRSEVISNKLNTISLRCNSILTTLQDGFSDLSDIRDYLLDPHKLAAEQRNESVQNQALSDFVTGSDSDVSLGTGKVGSLKHIGSIFSSSFTSDASPGDTFQILTADSDDGFWAFFGSSVYNELNGSSSDGLSLSSSKSLPNGLVIDPLERYSSFFGGD